MTERMLEAFEPNRPNLGMGHSLESADQLVEILNAK